jgi:hypothetical protein
MAVEAAKAKAARKSRKILTKQVKAVHKEIDANHGDLGAQMRAATTRVLEAADKAGGKDSGMDIDSVCGVTATGVYYTRTVYTPFSQSGGAGGGKAKKTKPNEKCPCGSKNKYKKCCGAN